MSYASHNLCTELFELSDWGKYWTDESRDNGIPAYDLSYLLRKLPVEHKEATLKLSAFTLDGKSFYYADYEHVPELDPSWDVFNTQPADTPEDAAAKLAIELFKRGVLSK